MFIDRAREKGGHPNMRHFCARTRAPFLPALGLVLVLVAAMIARDGSRPRKIAALRDGGAACANATCDGLGAPPLAPSNGPVPRAKAKPRPKPPAVETRSIFMRPPYDLSKRHVALTCGYHDSCKKYPGRHPAYPRGLALDWNDNNGTWPETRSVYFTASAHAPRPNTRIATVAWEYHRAGRDPGYPCATLVAVVYSYPKPIELFRVMYQHVAPVSTRPLRIYGSPLRGSLVDARPNVVVRIATMINDPCAYFTRTPDGRALFHVHVEPQSHSSGVRFRVNTSLGRLGVRVIPDVNGCGSACDGPVYPGPRWQPAYWKLWTANYRWRADARSGVLR